MNRRAVRLAEALKVVRVVQAPVQLLVVLVARAMPPGVLLHAIRVAKTHACQVARPHVCHHVSMEASKMML